MLALAVTAVFLVALVAGIGLGKVLPVPSPSASASLSPIAASSNVLAEGSPSLSPTVAPTDRPPQPSATPSAPPAHPVTATVEDQGIRLTLTLDRDRSSFEQRVWADVSVENIGLGVVYWGHSGTCPFAASVVPYPEVAAQMEYGREDWPGDAGILKMTTVDMRNFAGRGFTPEMWVDKVGNFGCTSDLRTSEVHPGDVLTYRAAWDAKGAYAMPAAPGAYRVEATFPYMSRGAPPASDARVDQFVVTAAVPFIVDGPRTAFLSPGLAVDAILADSKFQARLRAAPRGLWAQSDLNFEAGLWVLSLYLTDSDREAGVKRAIVAKVDAVSGVVVSVELVEGARPPGG